MKSNNTPTITVVPASSQMIVDNHFILLSVLHTTLYLLKLEKGIRSSLWISFLSTKLTQWNALVGLGIGGKFHMRVYLYNLHACMKGFYYMFGKMKCIVPVHYGKDVGGWVS